MPAPLILLSPSKSMRSPTQAQVLLADPNSPWSALPDGQPPFFLEDSNAIRAALRALNPAQLQNYYHISEPLAQKTHTMLAHTEALPAWSLYSGEAFKTLDLPSFSPSAAAFAADKLLILSALHGSFFPLTPIAPYRLDLTLPPPPGSPPATQGQSLTSFWRPRVTENLSHLIQANQIPLVLSLASSEFESLIDTTGLPVPLLRVDFLQAGGKKISARAKQARGAFVRWFAHQHPESCSSICDVLTLIQSFNLLNYRVHSVPRSDSFSACLSPGASCVSDSVSRSSLIFSQ